RRGDRRRQADDGSPSARQGGHVQLPLQRVLRQRSRGHGRADRGDALTRIFIERLRALTLNEQVIAALLGGAGLLLVEIRFEHREALGETWHAWLPLGYLLLLLLAGIAALL